ncbi:MAG: alpha/beta hydrolase family protein, partial [Pirellulaceae bacterium]
MSQTRFQTVGFCLAVQLVMLFSALRAQPPAEGTRPALQTFLQQQALALRAADAAPATRDEWLTRRDRLREQLARAWGGFPSEPCELQPRKLGELQREGYRVEMVIFQTMPGVWMTANAYVPARSGRLPAVLCVHGHWRGAKQDPVVQSRCIGLAKLGFFVLSVDAFGAGERGIEEQLGEYHGEMTGAMLLPIGRPLSGIQLYENQRAVDYLQSRPEVDPSRIGITGASGGGNQTMYAGAWDERFRCVVPTCSVGTYQAYLSAACCMCEVVPGALRFTEEGDILGLAAHRGLMITSATRDAYQFSVGEAAKSFGRVEAIARLYDGARVHHTIIESPHHYNQPMREAMYGWMTLHLKGEGDGSPIPEPSIQPEEPESIRCFPGDSRPDDYVTIPRFAFAEGQRLVQLRRPPDSPEAWQREQARARAELARLLGEAGSRGAVGRLDTAKSADSTREMTTLETEPGLSIVLVADPPPATGGTGGSARRLAYLLDLDADA